MADTNLSKRQEAVYNYLKKVISRSFPPTVREICEATGISSTSTVHAALSVLEEKGYIARVADNNDSRQTIVKLQPKGDMFFENENLETINFLSKFFKRLGTDDAREFVRLYLKLMNFVAEN